MYEENSQFYPGKPYWFQGSTDDILFYISQDPIATTDVTEGFCFPDLNTAGMSDEEVAALQDACDGKEYFDAIRKDFVYENFLFIRGNLDRYQDQRHTDDWFPSRMQLELLYWQTRSTRDGQLRKKLVRGSVFMADYVKPESGTSRGMEYDLRVTFVPVPWLEVLNTFSLGVSTYLLFYVAVDFAVIFAVVFVWGIFRLSTKQTNPPRLNFRAWMKGFELNATMAFLIVVIPVSTVSLVLKYGMLNANNPINLIPGDMNYFGPAGGTPSEEEAKRWLSGRIGIMVAQSLGPNRRPHLALCFSVCFSSRLSLSPRPQPSLALHAADCLTSSPIASTPSPRRSRLSPLSAAPRPRLPAHADGL